MDTVIYRCPKAVLNRPCDMCHVRSLFFSFARRHQKQTITQILSLCFVAQQWHTDFDELPSLPVVYEPHSFGYHHHHHLAFLVTAQRIMYLLCGNG